MRKNYKKGVREMNSCALSKSEKQKILNKRRTTQWLLIPVFLITLGLGWKYHWLGFVVPIVMLAGMVGGFVRGRYVCGNYCPRGSFFDRIWSKISLRRDMPSPLRNKYFRGFMFFFLIGMLTLQISRDFTNIMHWGYSFWLICFVTTIVGLTLGLFFRERTWCAFCPIGSFGNLAGGWKRVLRINKENCAECLRCEKVCPMNLQIVNKEKDGFILNRDCIQCQECVGNCPRGVLVLEKNTTGRNH